MQNTTGMQITYRFVFFVYFAFDIQRREACHVQRTRKIFRRGGTPSENNQDKTAAFVKQYQLTPREVDVLALLTTGKTNDEIASSLSVTKKCIEHHLRKLYGKLGVKTRVNAIVCAANGGFVAKD
ncbi:MAG: helix-turn-helix transcriptional regulator [Anaerolineae bacterium]|nr:helix-turn-helix transcriptional regulator [Anaerolineae bacterium]